MPITCFLVELAGRRRHGLHPSSQWLRNPATGEEYPVHDAPPGAMFFADWYQEGATLAVKLPDGTVWLIDLEYEPGKKWTRHGKPPAITATPSILTANYHGWLRDGQLIPV